MSILKSMEPLGSEDHYSHASGILTLFCNMTTADMQENWQTSGSMALLGASRHMDALYEICAEAEQENYRFRQRINELEAKLKT